MRLTDIKPQFILVMGGAGSGKNYYIQHDPVAASYKLIDVDNLKQEMGLDAAIGAIRPMLTAAFEAKKNVAHLTTGSNLKAQQNKIALAHQYGYKVTIVLVDTPIEQAIAQVRKRYREGGHNVELDAIVNSNKKARDNFEALKGLADEAIVVGHSSVNEDTATRITFKVDSPNGFSPSELNTIAKIIQSEGQVDAAGLMRRIKQAKMFCVAIDNNKIIGVSAIKIPNPAYRQGCFTKAGLADQLRKYPYEMGWKVVLPAYRGQNLGSQMSNKLFTKVNKQQVFATVRADNMASITPLTQMGFNPAGKPYYGAAGNKIILFTAYQ